MILGFVRQYDYRLEPRRPLATAEEGEAPLGGPYMTYLLYLSWIVGDGGNSWRPPSLKVQRAPELITGIL